MALSGLTHFCSLPQVSLSSCLFTVTPIKYRENEKVEVVYTDHEENYISVTFLSSVWTIDTWPHSLSHTDTHTNSCPVSGLVPLRRLLAGCCQNVSLTARADICLPACFQAFTARHMPSLSHHLLHTHLRSLSYTQSGVHSQTPTYTLVHTSAVEVGAEEV